MRLYESRLKPLNQSILISTAVSDRQPGLELDPWRKKRQQKPSTNRPDIRRRPTQSYEVAAQLKPASGFFSPPCLEQYYSRIRFSDINLRSQRVVTAARPGRTWQESTSGYVKDLDLCWSWLAGAKLPAARL